MPALWRGVLLVLAWLVPLGVLVQAATAAPTLLFLRGAIELHGALSFLVLGCALGVAIFTWAVRLGTGALVLAILSFLGLVGQTLLGYAIRGAPEGGSLAPPDDGLSVVHVSSGMFLLVFTLAVAFRLTRDLHLQRVAEEWTDVADEEV